MERLADPERELALSYARRPARDHLRALWLVDEKFGGIVAGTTDPTIGEMRLLWWREALTTAANEDRAEPLLEHVKGVLAESGGEWGAMAEGWHALLQEPLGDAELDRFANERGSRLFRLSAQLLTDDVPPWIEAQGRGWALTDLAYRISDPGISDLARSKARDVLAGAESRRWARPLRALGALAVLADRDARASERSQGAPSRVARMAWHRLTGR
ncbi:squalene/phytoene synthase family protein [Parasphingopyxis sp.]|uniref:squalene/phytoene synthase family protein n=1 Tax=Parasphingopyxis sp. TaxID=1920299 RepID=UPI002614050B|nr:squalene/phytoene synthase family protein [Parasphingopyxis sp.]